MKNASRLYDALLSFVGQCAWADQRHAYVLVWMVIGVIARWECESDAQEERTCKPQPKMPRVPSGDFPVGCTTLEFIPLVYMVHSFKLTKAGWEDEVLYLSLDTTMLWDTFCVKR